VVESGWVGLYGRPPRPALPRAPSHTTSPKNLSVKAGLGTLSGRQVMRETIWPMGGNTVRVDQLAFAARVTDISQAGK